MTIRFIGPLLCGGLLLIATSAFAGAGDPVPGVGVGGSRPVGQLKASGDTGAAKKGTNAINGRPNIKQGSARREDSTRGIAIGAGPLTVPLTVHDE
jgi:hypothetical protein